MVSIQFFGYRVQIHAENSFPQSIDLINRLRFDFEQFIEDSSGEQINLRIVLTDTLTSPNTKIWNLKTRNLQRYWVSKGIYYFENAHGTKAFLREGKVRTFELSFTNLENAQEQIFLFILSAIGEFLENRGWARIHGMSFVLKNQALVIPLRSGSGKSSFVSWLIENSDCRFLGDETIFSDGKSLAAFPIRRAIRKDHSEKKEFRDWPKNRIQNQVPTFKVLLFQNKFSISSYFWEFFWGLGNAQMAEYLLRVENLPSLVKMTVTRLRVFSRVRRKIILLPQWQRDPEENYRKLVDLLSSLGSHPGAETLP